MLDCPQKRTQSLSPKISTGDVPCCRQLTFSSSVHQKQMSQGDRAKGRCWCSNGQAVVFQEGSMDGLGVPLQVHSLDCRFQCMQKGMFLEQFSIFSLVGFMQHPMALKPEVKREEKSKMPVFSPAFYAVHLSHITSYSLLLYRKQISAALYAANKGGSQPCKAPT